MSNVTIQKRGKYYQYKFEIAKVDGKRKFLSKSGFKTKAEADILNVALFGKTAKEWKEENPELNGNMRDYVNILQLVILSNLENINSELIKQGMSQKQRLERLNEIAKRQGEILQNNNGIKQIEGFGNTKLLK